MQDMHHSLPIWCCLFEAKGDFPQNIDPDVTVKKSHYLMTSMPLANLYSKIGISIFSSEIGLRGMRWFVCFPGVTEAMTPFAVNSDDVVIHIISSKETYPANLHHHLGHQAPHDLLHFFKFDHFRVR